LKNTHTQLSPL